MDIIGIVGIILSLLIAYWEHMKAKKSDKTLSKIANELPNELIININRILVNKQSENEKDNLNKEFISSDNMLRNKYADLNNDGYDELLVEIPVGVHGTALQVYSRKDWEFQLLAELQTDTPVGFFLQDIDNDGFIEVGAPFKSYVVDLPYASGLRDFVWYRLHNNEFIEVKRITPTQEEIDEKLKEFNE